MLAFLYKQAAVIAAVSVFALVSLPVRAETITIVGDTWCPYSCAPDSDRPGFIVEIVRKAFSRHGIEVQYLVMPWSRAIEEARQNKYTGLAGSSHKDAPDFIFPSVPQGWMCNTFYVKPGNSWRYKGAESLADISLGAVSDYTYGEPIDDYIEVNKHHRQLVQLISGDNALEANIKKLQAGRIGAFIEDMQVVNYYYLHHKKAAPVDVAGSLPDTEQSKLYVAFSPKEPNAERYAKLLTQETIAMRKSGELAEILQKYGVTDWER